MALGPNMPDEPTSRLAKSAAAFRTISEVAEELEVPQHVLRFWETKFSQIRPLKRAGGRRYYRPADVELLRKVSRLLYREGYTIKGVQRLLRERANKHASSELPVGLSFDFIAEQEVSAGDENLGFSDVAIAPVSSEVSVKPVIAKRLDRASRAALQTLLDDLLELRALLKPNLK